MVCIFWVGSFMEYNRQKTEMKYSEESLLAQKSSENVRKGTFLEHFYGKFS